MFLGTKAIEDLMQLLRMVSKKLTELINLINIDKEIRVQIKRLKEAADELQKAIDNQTLKE